MLRIRSWTSTLVLVFTISVSCQGQIAVEDISKPPKVVLDDEKFANVFKSLDGSWAGKFYIYLDERGQTHDQPQPRSLDEDVLRKLPLKLQDVIHVRQTYISKTPYFQSVQITDTYKNDESVKQLVESYGANKVQGGKLWCVVVKPDETVIHSGSVPSAHTIIWQRELSEPLKIEYFKETVHENSYTILGWGYYGDDDPSLSPRYWFHGEYEKIVEKDN